MFGQDPSEKNNQGISYANSGNYKLAVRSFLSAAEENYKAAQYNLGICYEHGLENITCYEKQSNQEHPIVNAQIVKERFARAATWYLKSAEQGFAPAQYKMGIYYQRYGVDADISADRAKEMFDKAKQQGFEEQQDDIVFYNEEADTFYFGEESLPRTYEKLREKARQGDLESQNNLGYLLYMGKRYDEAVKWFQIASDLGFADSQFGLGRMYEHGYGVEKQLDKAKELYEKASEKGHKAAIEKLKHFCDPDFDSIDFLWDRIELQRLYDLIKNVPLYLRDKELYDS